VTNQSTELRSDDGDDRRALIAIFLAALLLFAPTVVQFEARTTDLSAIRILSGDVLYRDIWTMYAPGSIYAMALAYSLFGVHMIVGSVLGVLISALAVAAMYRFALQVTSPVPAAAASLVFAVAFLGAGYQNALTSYPPAILCIFIAAERIAVHAGTHRWQDLVTAGFFLGLAALFKHDVAGYACFAAAAAILIVPEGSRTEALRDVAIVATTVVLVMILPLLALLAAGAGTTMFEDLILYPLGYFRHVRPEYFPLLPPMPSSSLVDSVRRGALWGILTLPTIAFLSGLPGIARGFRRAWPPARRAVTFLLAAYPLFWLAGHVQLNTHKITIAGLGALVGLAGLSGFGRKHLFKAWSARLALLAILVVWSGLIMLRPLERLRRTGGRFEWVGLPRLEGIVATPARAANLRELAASIEEAGPPDSPLLLLGRRNDVLIYAGSAPYWLTSRRMVTAHHELHPGVTDTETVQGRMLEDVSRGPMPVLVLEHRFGDSDLDHWGDVYRSHGVPVGSRLLDEWVGEHYRPGRRIGVYELMRPAAGRFRPNGEKRRGW